MSAFALACLRSRTAFAIRTCSLLTAWRTDPQSMASQSPRLSESAPVDRIAVTVICILSPEDSPDSPAKKHQMDVSVSRRLPPGLGFFHPLSPDLRQPALRSACPMCWAKDRELPRSAYLTTDHVG